MRLTRRRSASMPRAMDVGDFTKRGEVVQGVAFHGDDVGFLSRLDGAGDLAEAQQASVAQRGGVERERVGDAGEFGEIGDLAPHVILRDVGAARICSQADGDALGKCLASALDDAGAYDVAVDLLDIRGMGLLGVEHDEGQRGEMVQVTDAGRPGSCSVLAR